MTADSARQAEAGAAVNRGSVSAPGAAWRYNRVLPNSSTGGYRDEARSHCFCACAADGRVRRGLGPRPADRRDRRQGRRHRAAAVLPGVTVEASSNVLPTPRTTVTAGERRLPPAGAAPGRLHPEVRAVRDAGGDPPGAGAAAGADHARRDAWCRRRDRNRRGARHHDAGRHELGIVEERRLERADPLACRSARTIATCSS